MAGTLWEADASSLTRENLAVHCSPQHGLSAEGWELQPSVSPQFSGQERSSLSESGKWERDQKSTHPLKLK